MSIFILVFQMVNKNIWTHFIDVRPILFLWQMLLLTAEAALSQQKPVLSERLCTLQSIHV